MLDGHSVCLILPCLNEEQGLRQMLPNVPSAVDEVLVVDNGSTDESVTVTRAFGARVIAAPHRGYGYAYLAGFAAAQSDIVVTMDADGTYPLAAIPGLVGQLVADDLDFISGCRLPLMDAASMDRLSRLGNWGLTMATRVLFGRAVRDSQSGMWVFRRVPTLALGLKGTGMSLSQEIKLRALARGLAFKEEHIPYAVRIGESKLARLNDGVGNLWGLFRLRFELWRETR